MRGFALVVWALAMFANRPAAASNPDSPAGHGSAFDDISLPGVAREVRIELDLGPSPRFEPRVEAMPGERAIEAHLPIDLPTLEAALARYPETMTVTVRRVEHGLRVRLHHPTRDLKWSVHRRGRHLLLLLGPRSEDDRLRALANAIRRPIPVPEELGAQLELWHEAERATRSGELELALKLWQKLAEEPSLRDLAELRAAELFVISGHVQEALHQLREVSRNHPRSTGAALARLTALHLEAITLEGDPTPAQVVIAATTGSRHRFHPFTWLRATAVLRELDHCDLALHHFPRPEQLPGRWESLAQHAQDDMVAAAVGRAAARDDQLGVITQFETWQRELESHPDRTRLRALAAEAYVHLGLHARAIPLLREQLSLNMPSDVEAMTIVDLARAYAAEDELDHHRAVVAFLVKKHPEAPEVASRMRALVMAERRVSGFDAAWDRAEALLESTRIKKLQQTALAAQIDLALAWGRPEQLVHALERMDKIGFDDPNLRAPQLAVALARSGRSTEAEPKLRAWIARTTDPERRDEMAYLLAEVDLATDRDADAEAILRALAGHETRWGRVARARLRELALAEIVQALEKRNAFAQASEVNG